MVASFVAGAALVPSASSTLSTEIGRFRLPGASACSRIVRFAQCPWLRFGDREHRNLVVGFPCFHTSDCATRTTMEASFRAGNRADVVAFVCLAIASVITIVLSALSLIWEPWMTRLLIASFREDARDGRLIEPFSFRRIVGLVATNTCNHWPTRFFRMAHCISSTAASPPR
jgi:hypothetical protein